MTINPDQVVTVTIADGMVYLRLADGRVIGNPLAWHEWLATADETQRTNVELFESSVYFPDLDEGLDIDEMVKGRPPRAGRKHVHISSS